MFASQINNHDNTSSLIDNENENEFLNESFAHEKKIEMIELDEKNRVELILRSEISSQILNRESYIDLNVEEHHERLFCYIAQLECALILENE
jgi:hypothetical protein